MKIWVLAMILVLTSCASVDVQQFVGPNGTTAYSLKCHSALDACYKKAGEICPSGYSIIDRATGTVAVPVYGGGTVAAPQHNLVIECK